MNESNRFERSCHQHSNFEIRTLNFDSASGPSKVSTFLIDFKYCR